MAVTEEVCEWQAADSSNHEAIRAPLHDALYVLAREARLTAKHEGPHLCLHSAKQRNFLNFYFVHLYDSDNT